MKLPPFASAAAQAENYRITGLSLPDHLVDLLCLRAFYSGRWRGGTRRSRSKRAVNGRLPVPVMSWHREARRSVRRHVLSLRNNETKE